MPSSSRCSEHSTVRRRPIRWMNAAPNGPARPPSRMLSEMAPDYGGRAPAECLLERHDQHAGRGAYADGGEDHGELTATTIQA